MAKRSNDPLSRRVRNQIRPRTPRSTAGMAKCERVSDWKNPSADHALRRIHAIERRRQPWRNPEIRTDAGYQHGAKAASQRQHDRDRAQRDAKCAKRIGERDGCGRDTRQHKVAGAAADDRPAQKQKRQWKHGQGDVVRALAVEGEIVESKRAEMSAGHRNAQLGHKPLGRRGERERERGAEAEHERFGPVPGQPEQRHGPAAVRKREDKVQRARVRASR